VGGQLATWIPVAVAVAIAWRVTRGGGGAAVAELERSNSVLERSLREERDAHQQTKDRMGAEVRDLKVEVAELRGRTDVAVAINAWGEQHEARAAERHVATLNVLDLIARRLGADDE
jgi:hypothetical protein